MPFRLGFFHSLGSIDRSAGAERVGLKIAKEAIDYAVHAGRKTVKDRDIKIVTKKVMTP